MYETRETSELIGTNEYRFIEVKCEGRTVLILMNETTDEQAWADAEMIGTFLDPVGGNYPTIETKPQKSP